MAEPDNLLNLLKVWGLENTFSKLQYSISAGLRFSSEYAKIKGNLQKQGTLQATCFGIRYQTGWMYFPKKGWNYASCFASICFAGAKKATDRPATVIYVVPPGAAAAILEALEAEMSSQARLSRNHRTRKGNLILTM
ncbi:succinate--CoA ligase [ADP/GDP-forming] subunit alpha, mitochondrial-like isoform X1 [Eurosta solidaginis]|uniref:succinate--CoA ligase [ADP/GDP-forming] subunit alpha, mitochondrial-like isoform X1 n=1 Tax=Eurosta solidaginis TaxID=178769 RepID=UPI0035314D9D